MNKNKNFKQYIVKEKRIITNWEPIQIITKPFICIYCKKVSKDKKDFNVITYDNELIFNEPCNWGVCKLCKEKEELGELD